MKIPSHSLAGVPLLVAALIASALPTPATAAQSYDNCTGFIDSVPATISTQGTWCLRQDIATAITSGNAITVANNNVTIDCNDYKLGGLAAGAGTNAIGIYALERLNTSVRHCNIRGFFYGVQLDGQLAGGGGVVEDSRFDGYTSYAIYVTGDGGLVRRNLVNDTGGSTSVLGFAGGIFVKYDADVIDNTISGVVPALDGFDASSTGIFTSENSGGSVRGNG
jgi:hypothetical protein